MKFALVGGEPRNQPGVGGYRGSLWPVVSPHHCTVAGIWLDCVDVMISLVLRYRHDLSIFKYVYFRHRHDLKVMSRDLGE